MEVIMTLQEFKAALLDAKKSYRTRHAGWGVM